MKWLPPCEEGEINDDVTWRDDLRTCGVGSARHMQLELTQACISPEMSTYRVGSAEVQRHAGQINIAQCLCVAFGQVNAE
jgi:hypothetical protein